MVVRFKQRYDVSTEGWLGDLFGKLMGIEKGQIDATFFSSVLTSAKKGIEKTYLNEGWLSQYKTSPTAVIIEPKRLYVNGKLPDDIAHTFDEFIDNYIAYRRKCFPKYIEAAKKLAAAFNKHSDSYTPGIKVIKEIQTALIKDIPAFPLMGFVIKPNNERVYAPPKVNKQPVPALSKDDIKAISLAILKLIAVLPEEQHNEDQIRKILPHDASDLLFHDFEDFAKEDEDDAGELAEGYSWLGHSEGYPGNYVRRIDYEMNYVVRTLDILMTRSLIK